MSNIIQTLTLALAPHFLYPNFRQITGGLSGLKSFLTVLVFFIFTCFASAATISWGGGNGEWQVDANWVGGVAPTASDDVSIGSGTVTIPSGVFAVARSLDLTSTLVIAEQLSISGAGGDGFIIRGTLTVNAGGKVFVNSCTNGVGINLTGTITNNGTITIGNTGATAFVGFYLNGTGSTVHNNGTVEVDRTGSNGLHILGGTYNNNNLAFTKIGLLTGVTVNGSGIANETGGGVVNNANGGTIQIDKTSIHGIRNQSFFNNYGNILVGINQTVGATGINIEGGTFNNYSTGTIEVNRTASDGFSSNSMATNSGSIKIGNNNTIGNNGLSVSGNTFTNSGTIEVSYTTSDAIYITGGTLNNNSTIRAGNANAVTGRGMRITGGSFTNASGARIYIDNCSNDAIQNSATLNNSGQILIGEGLTSTLSQKGIVQGGTMNNYSGALIQIDRTTEESIYLNSSFTNAGTITIGSLANVGLHGLLCFSGNFINNGTFEVNRTGPSPDRTALFVGTGMTCTNNGTMRFGNLAQIQYRAIRLNGGGTFTNASGAFIYIDNVGERGIVSDGTFNNNGILNIGNSSPIGLYGIELKGGTFTNNGSGVLTVNRITNGAAIYIESGDLSNAGSLTIGGSASITGIGIHCLGGGITNSGTLDVNNTSSHGIDVSSVAVTNTGTMDLRSSSALRIQSIGNLTNSSPGIVNLHNGTTLTLNSGSFLNNTSAINANTSSSISNSGTMNLNANGILTIASGSSLTNSGTLNNNANSTIVNNGTLTISGTTSQAGLLKGPGSVTGPLSNTGTLAPGNSIGTTTINGNFTNTGTVEIEIASAGSFDMVNISGAANLSGILHIIWLGGFQPSNGAAFTFMSFGSYSGAFSSINVIPYPNQTYSLSYSPTSVTIDVQQTPLPVELVSFTGREDKGSILLQWQTASEIDNEGFYLEHAAGPEANIKWETLGFVAGHGTSSDVHNYFYIDSRPQPGTNYYRLRQRDFDGREEFSKVINIKIKADGGIFSVYPNPASPSEELTLILPDDETLSSIKLFSYDGKIVRHLYQEQALKATISLDGLLPGVYWIEANGTSARFREKIVIK